MEEEALDALVTQYVEQTMVCSVWPSMRRAPAYPLLRAQGERAVPALLRNLASPEGGGMAVMHLLHELSGEWPEYQQVTTEVAPDWVGFSVEDAI